MREKEWKIEENLEAKERYELSIERLRQIGKEETTKEPYKKSSVKWRTTDIGGTSKRKPKIV